MRRNYLLTIIIISFIIRFLWLITNNDLNVISDAKVYELSAKSIVNTGLYTYPGTGKETAHYSPGYPYFIALFYKIFGFNNFIVKLVNVILGTLLVFLLFKLTAKNLDKNTALICSVIMAFFPSQIFWCNTIMSEVLFNVLGVSLFLVLLNKINYKYIISAIIFSLLIYVRSQGIILLPLVLLIILVDNKNIKELNVNKIEIRKYIKNTIVFFTVIVLCLSPWLIRNYLLFKNIVFTTNSGINFYMGVFPEADGTYIGKDKTSKYLSIPEGLNEYEENKIYLDASFKEISNNFPFYLSLIPPKMVIFLRSDFASLEMSQYMPSEQLWGLLDYLLGHQENNYGKFKLFIFLITQIFYTVIFILSIISFYYVYKNKEYNNLIFICYGVIIIFCLFHSLYVAPERYRAFLNPFFAILASYSVNNLYHQYNRKSLIHKTTNN